MLTLKKRKEEKEFCKISTLKISNFFKDLCFIYI